jgi:hypothetical protein
MADSRLSPVHGAQFDVSVGPIGGGVNFSYVIPAGGEYTLAALTLKLVNGVAVASRLMFITVTDTGGNVVCTIPDSTAQTAGQTCVYNYGRDCPYNHPAGATAALHSFPKLRLLPGWTIASAVSSIQLADQLSEIHLHFNKWVA